MQGSVVQYSTVQYLPLCRTGDAAYLDHPGVDCRVVQYSAMQYSAGQVSALEYGTVQNPPLCRTGDVAYLDHPGVDCRGADAGHPLCACSLDWLHSTSSSCLAGNVTHARERMEEQLQNPDYRKVLFYRKVQFHRKFYRKVQWYKKFYRRVQYYRKLYRKVQYHKKYRIKVQYTFNADSGAHSCAVAHRAADAEPGVQKGTDLHVSAVNSDVIVLYLSAVHSGVHCMSAAVLTVQSPGWQKDKQHKAPNTASRHCRACYSTASKQHPVQFCFSWGISPHHVLHVQLVQFMCGVERMDGTRQCPRSILGTWDDHDYNW